MGNTYFSCEKCGKENVVDLCDPEVIDYTKYRGLDTLTLSYKCKKCATATWLMLNLRWDSYGKLAGWDIQKSVHISDHKKISIKNETVKLPSKKKSESSLMSDKIDSLNSDVGLNEERILSAIWLGLVKLKLNAEDRTDIMNKIETITEEINSPKEKDKE
jgi:hypothetical protein